MLITPDELPTSVATQVLTALLAYQPTGYWHEGVYRLGPASISCYFQQPTNPEAVPAGFILDHVDKANGARITATWTLRRVAKKTNRATYEMTQHSATKEDADA